MWNNFMINYLSVRDKVKAGVKEFFGNERGDFGIKEIAVTIATVALIGVVYVFLSGTIGDWVQMIWDKCMEIIDGFIS